MKAKVTLTFNDDTVDAFADMFGVEDYSKLPDIIRGMLLASINAEDDEQLDELTVEMVE